MTKENKAILYICIVFSAFIFLLSAYINFSYLHPDEYFQIVEFASFKLGITPASSLSWEYAEHVRPALQPFLAYEVFRFLDFIPIRDHYTHLFTLRFLSAFFTVFSISIFCRANLRLIVPEYHRLFIIITFLFWPPYMFGVHFSSETWSGDCMLLATSLLLYLDGDNLNGKHSLFYFITGLLLGFAFLFRFQTAFFSIGIGAWLLFISREKFTAIIMLILGVAASMLVGLVIDRWFYGEWVCTPYLYFESNILKGVASEFGTKPFYTYFIWLVTFLCPPIGLAAIFGLIFLFIKLPKNIYTWILLPFLLAHSLIGHKELRFMFPLFLYTPVVCIVVYQCMREHKILSALYLNKKFIAATKGVLLASNFLFLYFFVINARSYSNDPKNFAPHIHQIAKQSAVNIIYTDPEAHPYILPHSRYKANVYPEYLREKNISSIQLASWDSLTTIPKSNSVEMISANKYEIEHSSAMAGVLAHAQIMAATLPHWLTVISLSSGIKDELDRNTYLLIKVNQ